MGKTTGEVEPVDPFDEPRDAWSSEGELRADSEASDDAGQQAAELRSGIEQTRAEMSETIDALQEKLDPARIAEKVKEQIRERATEAYDSAKESLKEATIGRAEKMMENVSDKVSDVTQKVSDATQRAGTAVSDTGSWIVDYVRENPIAFALIGAGLGALALNASQKQPSYRSGYRYGDTRRRYVGPEYGRSSYTRGQVPDYYPERETSDWSNRPSGYSTGAAESGTDLGDKAREIADNVAESARQAKERVSGAVTSAAASVRDVASNVADTTREQVNYLSAEARYRARTAGDMLSHTYQENPLALGVAALAAGALIGLVLPATRVESEYMGEARDEFVDKAKSVARETAEKVQRVTEEAGRALKQEAEGENKGSSTSEPAFPVKY